jgi:hypothetical protein
MARRRGRPSQAGKRKPSGRLRARAAAADHGNDRVQAMRALFAVFQDGRAGNELGDPIGKAWAAGLLEGFAADSQAMRDAGRDFGQLWRSCFGDLDIRNFSAERLGGSRGPRSVAPSAPSSAERRFDRMKAIVAAHSRNTREAFYGLCVDYQDSDNLPPFVERLINERLVLKGQSVAGTLPIRGDRERLERAADLLEALVAGARKKMA